MPSKIDPTTFDGLRQMTDAAFVSQLVDTFLEDAPRQIKEMKAALKEGDHETFRRLAHSIKSNAATFGAFELSDQARALEILGKENKLDQAAGGIDALEAIYKSVAQELRDLTE